MTSATVRTVDVEDWHRSTLNLDLPIASRVRENTYRLLDVLAVSGVHGTFLVLGLVAKRFPEIACRIMAGGHEVASPGWSHRPVFSLGVEAFRREMRDSVAIVEDKTGTKGPGLSGAGLLHPRRRLLGFRDPG